METRQRICLALIGRCRLILFGILLLLLPNTAKAEVPGCRVRHFDTKNGLPQNTVSALAFDDNHFLWVGTQGGLVKFNGQSFDKEGIDDFIKRVIYVFRTVDGSIFALGENGKYLLAQPDGNIVVEYVLPDQDYRQRLLALLFGNRDFFREDDAVMSMLLLVGSLNWDNSYKNAFINNYYTDHNAILGDSLVFIDKLRRLQYGFVDNALVGVDEKQQLLSFNSRGHKQRITKVEGNDATFDMKDFLENSIWVRGQSKQYVAFNGTFYSISLQAQQLNLQAVMTDLPPLVDVASSIYSEELGMLCIGTNVNGLIIIEPAIAKTLLVKDYTINTDVKDSHDNITSLLWSKEGEVIADNGYRYGKAVKSWIHNDSIMPSQLYQDRASNIWLGKKEKYGNIIILKADFKPHQRISADIGVGGFVQVDNETFWVARDMKLSRVKYDGNEYRCDFDTVIGEKGAILHSYIYDEENILIITSSGLYKYNHKKNEYTILKGTDSYMCRQMTRSPQGHVYVSTYGDGYFLLRGDSLIALPLDRKGNLRFPHTFVTDSKGFMWISTNNGLYQVKEPDLIAYANNEVDDIYLHYYDYTYGFATNEFNGGGWQSGLLAPNGKLYLASIKGLVVLNPNQIQPILPKFPITIHSAYVQEKTIDIDKKIKLPKGFKNFKIKVKTPFFGHPDNIQVSYRIKGFDESWKILQNEFELEIQSLKAGKYELEFRKLNGFGVNNYSYLRLPLEVEPYFYERYIFYVMIFISFIASMLVYLQYRRQGFEKRKLVLEAAVDERTNTLKNVVDDLNRKNSELITKTEMLNAVYSVVTHDLVSPLRFIQRTSARLNLKWEQMTTDEMKKHFNSLLQTSSHTEAFVKDLLTWIKTTENHGVQALQITSPSEIVVKNIQLFSWLADERGIQLRHEEPFDDTKIKISIELVDILIRNFVDNALKYTEKGGVFISAYVENAYLHIHIRDTGIGMKPEVVEMINDRRIPYLVDLERHLGMKIVFDIIEILNGFLSVSSQINYGTSIHMKIPLNVEID